MTETSLDPRLKPLPLTMAGIVAGYEVDKGPSGLSGASVFRLRRSGSPSLILKVAKEAAADEILAEHERLTWLCDAGIRCAKPIAITERDGTRWLLSRELGGADLADPAMNVDRALALAATALARLHSVPLDTCPFDERLDWQLTVIRSRIAKGLVNESDFDEGRQGQSVYALYDQLLTDQPAIEDLVVTHGDATFENLISDGTQFLGFVDCGRLGIADRYRDLALMARSIEDACGQDGVARFFDLYGMVCDDVRLAYYQLLDEFF